jgi:hypothetical protein
MSFTAKAAKSAKEEEKRNNRPQKNFGYDLRDGSL